jgi:hypothetical protein
MMHGESHIKFCYKTLHVSGIFSAHHQEFSTVTRHLISHHLGESTCSNSSSVVLKRLEHQYDICLDILNVSGFFFRHMTRLYIPSNGKQYRKIFYKF